MFALCFPKNDKTNLKLLLFIVVLQNNANKIVIAAYANNPLAHKGSSNNLSENANIANNNGVTNIKILPWILFNQEVIMSTFKAHAIPTTYINKYPPILHPKMN